jgi:hypothetical protein
MSPYDRSVRRALAALLLVALGSTGVALAARGDPQKRLTPADQARAKAMLVRRPDLPAGYHVARQSSPGGVYCAAVDESDLVLTGEARSGFARTPVAVASAAEIYRTVGNANAAWRRSTGSGGRKCLEQELRRELASVGVRRIHTAAPFALRPLAQRMYVFRIAGSAKGIPVVFDLVALQQGRAEAVLLFASALQPVARAEQARLAGTVATRMKTAMRGS